MRVVRPKTLVTGHCSVRTALTRSRIRMPCRMSSRRLVNFDDCELRPALTVRPFLIYTLCLRCEVNGTYSTHTHSTHRRTNNLIRMVRFAKSLNMSASHRIIIRSGDVCGGCGFGWVVGGGGNNVFGSTHRNSPSTCIKFANRMNDNNNRHMRRAHLQRKRQDPEHCRHNVRHKQIGVDGIA